LPTDERTAAGVIPLFDASEKLTKLRFCGSDDADTVDEDEAAAALPAGVGSEFEIDAATSVTPVSTAAALAAVAVVDAVTSVMCVLCCLLPSSFVFVFILAGGVGSSGLLRLGSRGALAGARRQDHAAGRRNTTTPAAVRCERCTCQ
jgi:hypothetical protein